MKSFLAAALEKGTVVMAFKAALVVGTVLAVINYGDRILVRHDMRALDWIKLGVTYLVPYCVASYGAARHATRNDKPPAA